MKIFFYKTLLVAFVFFITFKLTIGSLLNELENKFHNSFSKENIEKIKDDLRGQLNTAVKKDKFINKEDSELINAFIDKIKKDLKNQN
tara:strand:+ start:486 stop:749 length:264 start_codon:yes stop_codon:yes gene_type:complete